MVGGGEGKTWSRQLCGRRIGEAIGRQQAQQARDELRRVVGFSAADEIEKLDRLKKAASITDAEFSRLRAKLVQ